jgi:adenosylmethionine-8-amino-7-oxononanoate aminotransferase
MHSALINATQLLNLDHGFVSDAGKKQLIDSMVMGWHNGCYSMHGLWFRVKTKEVITAWPPFFINDKDMLGWIPIYKNWKDYSA